MNNGSEALMSALTAAIAEMGNPTKGNKASIPTSKGNYSYDYENLGDVLDIIKPALAKYGLCLRQGVIACPACYLLETGVSLKGETLTLDQRPIPFGNDQRANGSAETYLRRYALKTAFGLVGEDDDGEAATPKPESPYRARWQRIAELKAEAMSLGVKEEGIRSWMEANIGADMRAYKEPQLIAIEKHIQGLIDFQLEHR